jgi:hypothetical protein
LVGLNHFTVPIATSVSPLKTGSNERDSSDKLVATRWQKAVAVS